MIHKIYITIIVVLAIGCISLGYILYGVSATNTKTNDLIQQSIGREQTLKKQYEAVLATIPALDAQIDSLTVEIAKEPLERVIITTVHDEKIDNILNADADSSLQFFTDRISRINFD